MQDETRIVVLGHTGDGKSSSLSSIMMEKGAFKSSVSASSETQLCSYKKKDVLGVKLMAVDTPGLFDTKLDIEVTTEEVSKCMYWAAPGPHAFVYVMQIGSRFSKELNETLQKFRELFGPACTDYMVVLFNGMDNLEDDDNIDTLEEYIEQAPPDVGRLVSDCGGRVVGFNNRCKKDSEENKRQVKELLKQVESVKKMRGGYYTNNMLKEAERIMEERDAKLKKELEDAKNAEIERIKKEFKADFKAQEEATRKLEEQYKEKVEKVRDQSRADVESDKGLFQTVGEFVDLAIASPIKSWWNAVFN